MNNKLRIFLLILFICVFVVCGVLLLRTHLNYQKGERLYTEARNTFLSVDPATVTVPDHRADTGSGEQADRETPVVPGNAGGVLSEQGPTAVTDVLPQADMPDLGIDFDALRAVNPDIVGWLWIPGTDISYPLLLGETNNSYIYTTYDGQYSSFGSIFLDYRNQGNFTDRNTIIYGHNMKNGSMFGQLSKLFNTREAAEEHPDVYIFTSEATLRYEVFSSYVTRFDSEAYTLDFSGNNQPEAWLRYVQNRSNLLELEDALTAEDRLVTLSTCYVEEVDRFVVVGILRDSAET